MPSITTAARVQEPAAAVHGDDDAVGDDQRRIWRRSSRRCRRLARGREDDCQRDASNARKEGHATGIVQLNCARLSLSSCPSCSSCPRDVGFSPLCCSSSGIHSFTTVSLELRGAQTDPEKFRALANRISVLLGAEALRDVPTEDGEVETPLGPAPCRRIAVDVVVAPVIRAGLGMLPGCWSSCQTRASAT